MAKGLALLQREKFTTALGIATVFFLFSGQGIRYLLGLYGYGAIAITLIVLMALSFKERLKSLKPPILLTVFLVLASVTLLWSQTPLITAIALLVLIATTFVALVFVRGFSKPQLLRVIYRGLQSSLFVSIGFELLVALVIRQPVYPLFHEWLYLVNTKDIADSVLQWSNNTLFMGGPLQGFVGNRNLFGFIALLVGIIAPFAKHERIAKGYDAYGTLALALGVHMLTGSATVTFIAVVVAVLVLAAYIIRGAPPEKRRILSWGFVILAGLAAFASYAFRDGVTLLLGREPDLTNRTAIWRAVFDVILSYPQGTGWVSYWPVWLEPYSEIITLDGTPIAQAHNAFLDVWLQIGPLGVLTLLGLFLVTLISGWEQVETGSHGGSTIPLVWVLLAVALGLQGVTESRLLLEGNWFLLVVVVASVPQLIKNRGHLHELKPLRS